MLFFTLILGETTATASPDPRLLSLVPPEAQLVAGISAPSIQGQPDNFVLMTHNNTVDLEDFFALTGADDARSIHQIVFVSLINNDGQLSEHSLLVSGHFDQPHVFKSAAEGGAAVRDYHSVPILEIQPLARERGKLNDVRWLAILDSSILVFGSVASTRLELDRYRAQSPADGSLLRRLARLRRKDQTWCLLSASVRKLASPARDQEILTVLAMLNPEFAKLSEFADELEIGMHFGRHVEFEYEALMGSLHGNRPDRAPVLQSAPESPNSSFLLPNLNIAENAKALHGVIQISLARYEDWLARIKHGK